MTDGALSDGEPNPDVLWRVVGDEALLLDTITGHYFSLNPVATAIWQKLAAGDPPDKVAAEIAERYEINIDVAQRDIEDFLAEMRDANIWR